MINVKSKVFIKHWELWVKTINKVRKQVDSLTRDSLTDIVGTQIGNRISEVRKNTK